MIRMVSSLMNLFSKPKQPCLLKYKHKIELDLIAPGGENINRQLEKDPGLFWDYKLKTQIRHFYVC